MSFYSLPVIPTSNSLFHSQDELVKTPVAPDPKAMSMAPVRHKPSGQRSVYPGTMGFSAAQTKTSACNLSLISASFSKLEKLRKSLLYIFSIFLVSQLEFNFNY